MENGTFFEKFGTLLKKRSTHFLLQSRNDVTLQEESGATQELIASNANAQINPSAVILSNGIQNVSPVDFTIDVQYDEDAVSIDPLPGGKRFSLFMHAWAQQVNCIKCTILIRTYPKSIVQERCVTIFIAANGSTNGSLRGVRMMS